jgi:hypothetical protein
LPLSAWARLFRTLAVFIIPPLQYHRPALIGCNKIRAVTSKEQFDDYARVTVELTILAYLVKYKCKLIALPSRLTCGGKVAPMALLALPPQIV